jgi:hypothetical protein
MKDDQEVSSRKLIDRLVPNPRWGPMQGLFSTTYELSPDFLEMDFLPSVLSIWEGFFDGEAGCKSQRRQNWGQGKRSGST